MTDIQKFTLPDPPAPSTQPRQNRGHGKPPKPVLHVTSPAQLDRICDPGVELAIWHRRMAPGLGRWLDSLPIDELPDARVLVRKANARRAVSAMLDAAGTRYGQPRVALLDDIVLLTEVFAAVMETDLIDIRLETIDDDACWKFHRDHVPARLLTTYRGPTTEWVRPQESAAALAHQKSFAGPIRRLPRFAVGMFRGSYGEPDGGIVHRSPPVAGTGITRLLLCLNQPSMSSPQLWSP